MIHTMFLTWQPRKEEHAKDYNTAFWRCSHDAEINNPFTQKDLKVRANTDFSTEGVIFYLPKVNPEGSTGNEDITPWVFMLFVNPSKLLGRDARTDLYTGNSFYPLLRQRFNSVIEGINTKMGGWRLPFWDSWNLSRIDYCYNIQLENQGRVLDYIRLLKKGRIPWQYLTTDRKYDGRGNYTDACRYPRLLSINKKWQHSHYILGESVNINIYDKFSEIQKESSRKPSKKDLEDTDGILRFEIQFKPKKTRSQASDKKRAYKKYSGAQTVHKAPYLYMSAAEAKKYVLYYARQLETGKNIPYRKYTVTRDMLAGSGLKKYKDLGLWVIDMLTKQNMGLWKLRELYASFGRDIPKNPNAHRPYGTKEDSDKRRSEFDRCIRAMRDSGINPVTIPDKPGKGQYKGMGDSLPSVLHLLNTAIAEEEEREKQRMSC